MSNWSEKYTYIETQEGLERFGHENEKVDWLCFDTEFVGEKRYLTQLCLLQVATENGNYLIDPFGIEDLSPFLKFVEDPAVEIITHAGDNDYRLLHQDYDLVPTNIFDTQLAAGFAGYRYPISFSKLVTAELNVNLNKGLTVVDWERRPLEQKYLRYALYDVLPLPHLWRSLRSRLEEVGRLEWAREEFAQWENPRFYDKDPNREALKSNMIKSLKQREQVFLIRLFNWRRQRAEAKDYSKEMILPAKIIGQIVRSISSGRDGLIHNRRIPRKIGERYGKEFEQLYKRDISPEEKELLRQIPTDQNTDPQEELAMELLYVLIKYKCLEDGISHDLVLPKNIIKRLKVNPDYIEEELATGWRGGFLGKALINGLRNFERLHLELEEDKVMISLNGKKVK